MGDRICLAHFMRESVRDRFNVNPAGWVYRDKYLPFNANSGQEIFDMVVDVKNEDKDNMDINWFIIIIFKVIMVTVSPCFYHSTIQDEIHIGKHVGIIRSLCKIKDNISPLKINFRNMITWIVLRNFLSSTYMTTDLKVCSESKGTSSKWYVIPYHNSLTCFFHNPEVDKIIDTPMPECSEEKSPTSTFLKLSDGPITARNPPLHCDLLRGERWVFCQVSLKI